MRDDPDASPDTSDAAAVRLTATVRGHVQGVGYRAFCQRTARALERDGGTRLTGYARNLADGRTVEVVAEGARPLLERLLAALREGPGGAHVIEVRPAWGAASREFDGFRAG